MTNYSFPSAAGLKELIRKKISHRDIKPHNILLNILKSGEHVYKICDFGFAKYCDEETLATICGTPHYTNPALLSRLMEKRIDVSYLPEMELWTIGVTLYQLATGRLPFILADDGTPLDKKL